MSVPATTNTKLPAYLQDFGAMDLSLNEAFSSTSKSHATIGIKASKFRIRENGDEQLVNSFTLDVIIVNANKHKSKTYYAEAYTGEDNKSPNCYSDNGIGPSSQASNPQSKTCAACPHNVWGSKITPAGKQSKACADYKKLAVVLADDPERNVYELRVPGASLDELNKVMVRLTGNNIPIPTVVFQLSFDAKVDYPKLVFKAMGYVSEDQAVGVRKWIGSEEAKNVVGANDVPVNVSVAPAHTSAISSTNGTVPKVEKVEPAQQDPMAFINEAAPEEPKKRGRPTKSEKTVVEPAEKQLDFDLPGGQPAAQATTINPDLTDPELDNLLSGIL